MKREDAMIPTEPGWYWARETGREWRAVWVLVLDRELRAVSPPGWVGAILLAECGCEWGPRIPTPHEIADPA